MPSPPRLMNGSSVMPRFSVSPQAWLHQPVACLRQIPEAGLLSQCVSKPSCCFASDWQELGGAASACLGLQSSQGVGSRSVTHLRTESSFSKLQPSGLIAEVRPR